jgi:hypothetical protein
VAEENWTFHIGPDDLEIDAPDGIDRNTQIAIWDLATSDIGNSMWMWNKYRQVLTSSSRSPAAASNAISGNATSLHVEGDDVVLEALYDQWPTVQISKVQFEAFLDQFGDFLKDSGSGA